MALKKDLVVQKTGFDGFLVAKNAYWKITKLTGNKDSMNVEISAFVGDEIIDRQMSNFKPQIDGVNFIAQAYGHLKSTAFFQDAVDC